MPAAVPLPPLGDDSGAIPFGQFWGSTDHSTSGSPISTNHQIMDDTQLTGATVTENGGGVGGNTHLYVATLVMLALGGIILFHVAGFRFTVNAGVGRG